VVNCPENDTIEACATQQEIDTALADWFADFSYSGGANPTAVYTVNGEVIDINTYELPDFDPCEGGAVTITLTVTDECEQEESCSSTFTVLPDDEDPTASNPLPITVECIDNIPDPDITVVTDADDNCDTTIVTHQGDESDNDPCEPTITRTYKVSDPCENFILVTQTINVEVEDFEMPEDDGSQVACEADAVEPTPPVVEDNCGNVIDPTGPTQGGTYDGCEGTITYTWNYEDCEGNNHDWVYTYLVEVEDFEMPEED
jgi:hypothetical protein